MDATSVSANAQLRGLGGPCGMLLIAVGVVVLLVASGGQANVGLAVSRIMVDGGVVAIWALAGLGLGSAALRSVRLESGSWGGGAMAAGLGWGAMGLLTLGLGLVGVAGPVAAWGVVAGALLAGAWAVNGRAMGIASVGSGVWVWAGWGAAGVLGGIALFLSLFPAGLFWPTEPNGYDVLGYHLQLPREWYEAGAITVLPHNVFSYMPLAMEVHYLMAMGLMGDPWGGMYVAQLMHLAMWVAAAVGAFGVGRSVGGGRLAAGWGACGVVAACPLTLMLAAIAYNEGAVVLYGVLVVRAMVGVLADEPHKATKWAVLAGVCGGLAAGAKLTAIPLWLLWPAVVLAVASWRGGAGLRVAGVLLLAGGLTAAPWLLRTAVNAGGNPVFPVAARVLGSPGWDDVRIERFERAHAPRADQQSATARAQAFWAQVLAAPEFGWVLVPGALGLGVVALVCRQGSGWDGGGGVWLVLLAGHLVVWLGLTHLQGRFWVPALPVMAALWAAGMRCNGVTRAAGLLGVALSGCVAAGLVWVRLEPFRTPEGRLVTEIVGVDFRAVERLLVPAEVLSLEDSVVLNLVGDGRGYAYRRPMAKLKYTYVFDVVGESVEAAWRVEPGEWLLVSPSELRRFSRTYAGIPPLPPAWESLESPTLMAPGDPRRSR